MQIENTTFEKHYRIGGLAETRVSTAKLCGSWSRMIRALRRSPELTHLRSPEMTQAF